MAAKSPDKELISESLGKEIQKKVKEMGSNPRRLSVDIGYAYDHVRKVYNGEVFPGKTLLKKLCDRLELNYNEMLALVNADKAFVKGNIPIEFTDEDELLIKLKRSWKFLSKNDRQEILATVQFKADRAIKHG